MKRGEKERREVGRGEPVKTGESIYFKRWVMNRCHSYLSAQLSLRLCSPLHQCRVYSSTGTFNSTVPTEWAVGWRLAFTATAGPGFGSGSDQQALMTLMLLCFWSRPDFSPHFFLSFFWITRNDLNVKYPYGFFFFLSSSPLLFFSPYKLRSSILLRLGILVS